MNQKVVSIRLDPHHIIGVEIARENKKKLGFSKPTVNAIVREALEAYFATNGITHEMIVKELRK